MQNLRSWESGYQCELEDVCRREVAIRSFIEARWSTYAEQIILPSNRAAARASSLQTVYDLAVKRRVGLRFNCKKSDLKMCQSTIYLQSTPALFLYTPVMSLNVNITGLQKLQRELEEAQRGCQSLNATLKFDPADSNSVKEAIRQMEAAVDGKVASYRGRPNML
jgi:hypothetical protein